MLATVTAVSVGTAVLGTGAPAGAVPSSKAPATGKSADFNGDGYGDLAVSANGYVAVMYGTKTGLSASRHQTLAGNPGTDDGGAGTVLARLGGWLWPTPRRCQWWMLASGDGPVRCPR
ncbi:hypothetical protein ACFYW8_11150 [Streptomyces sp. NPDC002742]|uniref:hypothetical protein n=1 Tax=Streptomyces sp. NPDC002742 TaxID=3364663 RepID=UPI003689662D